MNMKDKVKWMSHEDDVQTKIEKTDMLMIEK